MTIDLERLPNCSINLRIEAPASTVQERRKKLVRAFAQQARIPGYRPGKVPDAIIESRYKAEIDQELKESMIGEGLREAIRKENLKLVAVTSVKDVDLEPDLTFRFRATLSVEPEFELPDYLGIPVTLPSTAATEEEVEGMFIRFREQEATFEDITDRPLQMEDFAVVESVGTLGGKPLQEVFEDLPPNIARHKNLWIRIAEGVFLPGFPEQLVGMQIGETRAFDLAIPSDFMIRAIAGETLHYTVTLRELKRRVPRGHQPP
ncbi:MAG: trigger factor [Verrucomicrobiia bacterium]